MRCHQCNAEYCNPNVKGGTAYFVCSECGHCYEVEHFHGLSKDQIIEAISQAFLGVTLGNGIGLWQAQAIDDYGSTFDQKAARQKDEKERWDMLSGEELQGCHSSLSFFDADGMRFHLPAFIIKSIQGEADDPLVHLTRLDDYSASRLTSLNSEHKKAVSDYLIWCLTEDEYRHEQNEIREALQLFWRVT